MKRVNFPPNTRYTTKERVLAILWACYRRGDRAFESPSGKIRTEIADYLRNHGASYTHQEISVAIQWLLDHGYATRRHHERKTYRFSINEDVDLKVQVPYFVQQNKSNPTDTDNDPLPALPGEPPAEELYRLDELIALLGEWGDTSPEAYAEWVDKVILRLQKETTPT